jgi:hypothetical protein
VTAILLGALVGTGAALLFAACVHAMVGRDLRETAWLIEHEHEQIVHVRVIDLEPDQPFDQDAVD